ncbi:MAG: ATP-dependent zinc metalloprotease FtsH [Chloroflexi bacterium]|nr:ATP-dependent zinc metalloprotease FtsH [Chloroflexota bacterium]
MYVVTGMATPPTPISWSEVVKKAQNGEIATIQTNPNNHNIIIITQNDPNVRLTSTYPAGRAKLDEILDNAGVTLDRFPQIESDNNSTDRLRTLLLIIPLFTLLVMVFLYLRPRNGDTRGGRSLGGGPGFAFGKSSGKLVIPQRVGVNFADVAGADEAKQELEEIVEFLKHSEKFTQLGARIPKGVLLVGPPGTGKTLLAKAVAGEANVPFISISGSEFVEMYVGVGAARVRDLFERAKKMSPCIIFIDEVDAVGRKRGIRAGGGTEEREQTLNQILVEMDGFNSETNVIVIAATNRVDVLDPAFLRPGRFDRQVTVDNPDYLGRIQILKVHSRGKPLDSMVELERIAKQTPGFSGADLANLMNEAAILTARRNKKIIGLLEMEEAIDRVVAGPERKSRLITDREKVITAYHEVGHALVAQMVGSVDPVQKISIVARGRMGGYTRVGAGEDRTLWTRSQLEDFMAFALGGHAAEALMFGEVTTGPSNDIERVTQIARSMVCEYGMSAKLGPISFGDKQRGCSNTLAYEIDKEVNALVQKALLRAHQLLTRYNLQLIAISNALIEQEIMSGDEMNQIFESVSQDGGANLLALRPFASDALALRSSGKLGEANENEPLRPPTEIGPRGFDLKKENPSKGDEREANIV